MPNDYNRALATARQKALSEDGPQRTLIRRLNESYARMLADIAGDADEGRITEERAEALRRSVNRAMLRMEQSTREAFVEQRRRAMEMAVEGHVRGTRLTVEGTSAQIDAAAAFAEVPDRVLREGMRRRPTGGAQTFRSLIRRGLQESAAEIDEIITSAVGRGVSNQRLARDLAIEMAAGDEEILDILENRVTVGRRSPGAIAELFDDEQMARRVRSLLNDARLIAVHEINSHYDEANAIAHAQSPVVDLVRWRLSSQHGGSYAPDMCDVMAQQDLHGYGAGMYHPETVPSLTHPRCQCWKEAVIRPRSEWGAPNRPRPDRPKVAESGVRKVLEETEGQRTVTDKYVQNQTSRLNAMIGLTYENPR